MRPKGSALAVVESVPGDAKPIPGFPGYFVGSDGGIFCDLPWRGNSKVRRLRQQVNVAGYPKVWIYREGRRYPRFVHALVAVGDRIPMRRFMAVPPPEDFSIGFKR